MIAGGDGCFRDVLGSQRGLVVLNRNVTHASFKTCQGRFFRPLSLLFQHVYSSISLFISYLVSVFCGTVLVDEIVVIYLGWPSALAVLSSSSSIKTTRCCISSGAVVFQVEATTTHP